MNQNEPEKIIQIAATAGGEENATDVVYALSSTGRIFMLINAGMSGSSWYELPPMPHKPRTP